MEIVNKNDGENKPFDLAVRVEGLICRNCNVVYNNILTNKCFWCMEDLVATWFIVVSAGLKIGFKIIDTTQIGKKEATKVISKGKVINDGSSEPKV